MSSVDIFVGRSRSQMGLGICLAGRGGGLSTRKVTGVCRPEGESIEKVSSIDDIDEYTFPCTSVYRFECLLV